MHIIINILTEHPEMVCHDYLGGMQWVITYYLEGVPDWKWYYPYHYAPSASMICENMKTFVHPEFDKNKTTAADPFQQLLSVLPPKSAYLLPQTLQPLLLEDDSPLKSNCPETFEIDYDRKKKRMGGYFITTNG